MSNDTTSPTKVCAECKRDLPISEYNKRAPSPDGLQDRCRECFSRYNRARYAANREATKAAVYKYRDENPDKVLETRLKVCAKNPTHRTAYRAVEAAITAGVIERSVKCQGCGLEHDFIHGHHHDYTAPLAVIWLCPKCHFAVHRSIRERAS